jgi:hypothetical protein
MRTTKNPASTPASVGDQCIFKFCANNSLHRMGMDLFARGVRYQSRWTLISIRRGLILTACTSHRFLVASTMGPKGRDDVLSSLNMSIGALNHAKEATSVVPAKTAFTSASLLLATIRVSLFRLRAGRLSANVYRTRWSKKRNTSNWR